MYKLSRWPANVSNQIDFLNAVVERWGAGSDVGFSMPYEGYPGYIKVVPEKEIRRDREERDRCRKAIQSGIAKLTNDELVALHVRVPAEIKEADEIDVGFPGTAADYFD